MRALALLALLMGCQRGTFNPVGATIAEVQDAVRGGVACTQIIQAHLDRIAAYDKPTGLNAITVINPKALGRADEIDADLRAGRDPGPLFCAPIFVMDNLDTHSLPTTGVRC